MAIHHQKTFEAVKAVIPRADVGNLADYFDLCCRKRNDIDYDAAEVFSDSETEELVKKAKEFETLIENWITNNHPGFSQ